MKKFDIITVGSASRDLFIRSEAFRVVNDERSETGQDVCLTLGTKIEVSDIMFSTGGGATNAAATFANLGLRAGVIARVGDDENGKAVLAELRRRRIVTSLLSVARGGRTAFSVLLSALHRGRTVLVFRGVAAGLNRSNIPLGRNRASWLYLTSLAGNLSLNRWIIETCRTKAVPVMWNPGAAELERRATVLSLAKQTNVFLVNREEANRLAGTRQLSLRDVLRKLAPLVHGVCVVTDGENGAMVGADGRSSSASSDPAVRAFERTGAGDAFGSGFLAGLMASSGNIATALMYATANAESVIRKVGAKEGLLTRPPEARYSRRIHSGRL